MRMRQGLRQGVWMLAALLLAGCGARREYVVSTLAVTQDGWDTLAVEVTYAQRTVLGGDRPAVPSDTVLNVFDAAYDTLYSGARLRVGVPDQRLGDREALMVEVCGTFSGRSVCEQQAVRASPKRLQVRQDITYPEEGDFDRGRYALRFTIERERFGGDGWEPADAREAVPGYLLAYVDGAERNAVRVPFTDPRGRFDLRRLDNYKNFRYALDARLFDEQAARVRFEVYAGLGGPPARLASVEKEVSLKSREVRVGEVRHFVREAVDRIVEALQSFMGGRRAVAYIDRWRYDAVTRRYNVDLEVQWRGSFFRDRRYELSGLLQVDEGGARATFRRVGGSDEALRRWRDRVGGDLLQLGDLPPPELEVSAADSARSEARE